MKIHTLGKKAFTLIELLAVMAIIAILVGLVIGMVGYAMRSSAEKHTKALLNTMELAVETYRQDNGYYPISDEDKNEIKTNNFKLYRSLAGNTDTNYPVTRSYMSFRPGDILTETKVVGGVTNYYYYISDAYGEMFNYYNPTNAVKINSVTFDLWSRGADGVFDTFDDITNWRR